MATLAGAQRRIRGLLVDKSRNSFWYPAMYPSWWHRGRSKAGAVDTNFLTGTPNPGAGIGHQMANWIAGYAFARRFGLRYAHSPFPAAAWERMLNLGAGETSGPELLEDGYKRVRLPMFDENSAPDVAGIERIIRSYAGERVVFVLEQDQFFFDQGVLTEDLAKKYWAQRPEPSAPSDPEGRVVTVAIHIRRGDIVAARHNEFRLQSVDYFSNVLRQLTSASRGLCRLDIKVFSQGAESDFASLRNIDPQIQFCLDWDEYRTFDFFTQANVLVTSKSSFSYKAALLSRGLRICPEGFWHGYPSSDHWLIATSAGDVDLNLLKQGLVALTTLNNGRHP